MRNFALKILVSFSILSPCLADLSDLKTIPVYLDRDSHFQLDYEDGYTNMTIFEYHLKITAEQRMSDNLLQIIAIPQEQGIRFTVLNVRLKDASPGINISGPVAEVEGVAIYQRSTQVPIRVRKIVPVQIASVSDFSISRDEAEMQGYNCFQKRLSRDFSDSSG